jgi:post-segregation antitoxin (ccd killing protein)
VADAVADARWVRWLDDNNGIIDACNERVEREGPIVAKHRRF